MAQVQNPLQRLPQAAAAAACCRAWKALVHIVRVVAGRGRVIRALADPRERIVPAAVGCLSIVACTVPYAVSLWLSQLRSHFAGRRGGQQRKAAEPARGEYVQRSALTHGVYDNSAEALSGEARCGQQREGLGKRSSQQCIMRTAFEIGTALGERHQRHVER